MSKDMLGITVRKLVTLPPQLLGIVCDLLEKLADSEWVEATKKFLRKENPWGEPASLLKRVSAVTVAGAKRFCAKDHLKEANVGWTSPNFQKLFQEKVEENVPEAALVAHHLERDSLDAPIMAKLGDRAVIQLAHFFELLKKQSKGEDGTLLVNGRANIAYILGSDGNVWAVDAYWPADNGDWRVHASSVGNPRRWAAGYQVLSRDS